MPLLRASTAVRVARPLASVPRTSRVLATSSSFSSRYFSVSTTRADADPKKPEFKNTFKGQLYESTAERVKAQREAEARIARLARAGGTTGSGSGGGSSRIGAGLFAGSFIAASFYYLGTLSTPTPPEPTSTLPLHLTPAPQYNLTPANLEASWAEFVALLGEQNVSTKQGELERHSTSDWSSHPSRPGDALPFLVVFPSSTQDVSDVVKICNRRQLPVTGFSGGTSLEGHFSPTRGGVVVDFGRMDKILQIHDADLDCVVQPAVGWEHLNDVLAERNLFFPPDPGPGAMIGGMVGTGCSGTNAARYGTMREWVLGLTVVLADGTIVKTRQRPRKSSAGYNLTQLFIGSEGTLGLVTEATLKLAVKPPHETVAVAAFPSIRAATDVVAAVVAKGIQVAAVELLDDVQMRCINAAGMTERAWAEKPTLFFKFAGGTPAAVKEQVQLVRDIIKSAPGGKSTTFEFARNREEGKELWEARKEALWSVVALKDDPNPAGNKFAADTQTRAKMTRDEKRDAAVGGSAGHRDAAAATAPPNDEKPTSKKVWTTDVAVPVSRLSDIVDATKADIAKWSDASPTGGLGAIVGHVGDGNFHCILLFDEQERAQVEELVHRMVTRAIEMEGTVTGEHGVGLVKRDYLGEELGTEAVDLMRRVKVSLDPKGLLNVDKVVRVVPKGSGEH